MDSTRGPFFTQFLLAVTAVEDVPFSAALDHAAFDRSDLTAHRGVDRVALPFPLLDEFARLAEREVEVGNLGQPFVTHPHQRFAREIKNTGLTEFHCIFIRRTPFSDDIQLACHDFFGRHSASQPPIPSVAVYTECLMKPSAHGHHRVNPFCFARRCLIIMRNRSASMPGFCRASVSACFSASSSNCRSSSKFADIISTTHATRSFSSAFGVIEPFVIRP